MNGKSWDKHNRLLPQEYLQSNFMVEAKLLTQSDMLLNKHRGNTLKNRKKWLRPKICTNNCYTLPKLNGIKCISYQNNERKGK